MATTRRAPTKFTTEAKEAFLDEYYENGGYQRRAAEAVGHHLSTVQYHIKHNAKFARQVKAVEDELWLERSQAAEVAIEKVRNGTNVRHNQMRGKTRDRDWKPTFLKCLAINGCVQHAAHAAGIARETAHHAKQKDEEFALAWHDAVERSTESLEAEGICRALNTSDLLLMFFLKARRPHLYRENAQIWKEQLDEQHMATIVEAVKNAAFATGLAADDFQSFTEELEQQLRKFEKAGV
jgi:hypothetical protein